MRAERVAPTIEVDCPARPGGWEFDCFADLGRLGKPLSPVACPPGISNVVDFHDSIG
jgi:hypothetical protein